MKRDPSNSALWMLRPAKALAGPDDHLAVLAHCVGNLTLLYAYHSEQHWQNCVNNGMGGGGGWLNVDNRGLT